MALKFIRNNLALIIILLLASLLRFWDIQNDPKAMYGDELTAVYDAYSILKTGRDQRGNFLPTFFELGGGRPAGYIYATVPFVALFGPTPLASRAVSLLSGIGIVWLVYLISLELIPEFTRDQALLIPARLAKRIGLLAALSAALMPWELSLSRGPFETHFALFLSTAGIYFLLKARSNYYFHILAAIAFALSIQTYLTYVLSLTLFTIVWAIYFRKTIFKLNLQKTLILVLSVAIFASSLIFSVYTSSVRGSRDRFSNISIFNQSDLKSDLTTKALQAKAFSPLPEPMAKLIHNRFTGYLGVFWENYLKNFGLDFLFITGDGNPRHNPAGMGEFYWLSLVLIPLGIFYLSRTNVSLLWLLALWVLIPPVANSLVGPPHALRGSFMLIPLILLNAFGLSFLLRRRGAIILKGLAALVFLIQFGLFLYIFYFVSPGVNSGHWSYPAKEASLRAIRSQAKFDYIILSSNIADAEFAYPVYAKLEPKLVIEQNMHPQKLFEYRAFKYDNVYITSIPKPRISKVVESLPGKVLYIGSFEDRGFVPGERIQRDVDQTPLYVYTSI